MTTFAQQRTLRLGTRSSPLALAQAEEARDRLIAAHPGLTAELVPVVASGDKVLDRPLADIGGKALWTKELDQWLLAGTIDVAVHSLKDVETLRPDALTLAAVLPREDVRDCLVGAASLADLPPGSRIATSAPRRAAQALNLRPDCRVVGIRGNVQTRLAKLAAGEADATLLARAGLNRLGRADVGTPLDPQAWLPAPGQGAIALECRTGDADVHALLAAVDDDPSHLAVRAERALLAALGGTCHSPVAVLSTWQGEELRLDAALYSADGAEKIAVSLAFLPGDAAGPQELAARLLDGAGPAIRRLFDPPNGW